MTALTNTWVLTRRELLHTAREPWTLVFGLAFSIMILLMFALLFGGAMNVPGGGAYIAFLLPGMLTLIMMFGLDGTRDAMAKDVQRGVTDRFRSLPISGMAVAGGRVASDMLYAVVELAILGAGGLLLGWRIEASFGAAVLGFLLLLWLRFAMLWVGIFLGIALRGAGGTAAVQVLVWPVGFLSTVFVSAESMPAWLAVVAEWNPISATAAAVRQLFGNPTGVTGGWAADSAVLLAVLWPLLLTAVFAPLSARAYRRLGR